MKLECRRFAAKDTAEVVTLLTTFLGSSDISDHSAAYGNSGSTDTVGAAIALLSAKPALGFLWLALKESQPVAVAVVCFAVSTNLGALVAKIPDFVVREDLRGCGVGSALLGSLAAELRAMDVMRIDLGVHDSNVQARAFYEHVGFKENHEMGMSLIL